MKQILFALFLVMMLPTYLSSQSSLEREAILPRTNDTIVKQRVEYRSPGRTGKNVLWNFSKLKILDEHYTVEYGQEGDSLVGTEHDTRYYYGTKKDSLLFHGYEKSTVWMKYVRPEVLLRYPMKYNDSIHSYFQGLGKYCNDLSISIIGKSDVSIDAFGMMILPNEDTLKHVLRSHSIKLITEGSEELNLKQFKKSLTAPLLTTDSIESRLQCDSVVMRVETFKWYELGYRYPIFETILGTTLKKGVSKDFFYISFYYPPQEHLYLNEDEINLVILDTFGNPEDKYWQNGNIYADNSYQNEASDPWGDSILSYDVYWDYSGQAVCVDYSLATHAQMAIYLYAMQGRILASTPARTCAGGTYSETINLAKEASGQYLLLMLVNEEKHTKKIIKP